MKFLMVCLGNICRSPLAEGILKAKIEAHRLDWVVDSAGTSAWHLGERPDRRSVLVAKENGININDQRARQFRPTDLTEFDHIFVMDQDNYKHVMALAEEERHREKVSLILNMTYPDKDLPVPDPYYDDNGFEHVFRLLDRACDEIISKFRP